MPAFVCPKCKEALTQTRDSELTCLQDNLTFEKREGIWRFLLPEREKYFEPFMREYQQVREAEGRKLDNSDYFQALPFKDLSHTRPWDWSIRAISYRALIKQALAEMETGQVLNILDLGAGNAWLSNRLAQRGHQVSALDLHTNDWDGLGAIRHYAVEFKAVQAEFDFLPYESGSLDLIIFNAAFHYSEDYLRTLNEAQRCLVDQGRIVVMDTPIYRDPASGEQMVAEREAYFLEQVGFRSNQLDSQNFLTVSQIQVLAEESGLKVKVESVNYGLQWALRPWLAKLRGAREPAEFRLIIFSNN